ncbi:regulator of nonsense transcripts 3A isoform X5 [Pan troglodytes]|uniref:regulator of nonsense transcripts 3A isoform X5 n=1 Tax=Pan troglodytes TaxID=9598 RepID=UPI003013522A
MRSEKEGAGGLRAAVAARGPSGREKLSALEVQFHRDSQQQEAETAPTSSSGCGGGAGKPREEKRTALSKVVIRRLPPGLTKEQLEEQLRPLPAHDYFEFFAADLSLYPHLYSRAYINFRNPDDILLFRDRFDGYIFLDSKGLEYPAVVEFAPFQKIAKKKLRKKDAKTGSIEDDPEYKKFLETYWVEEEKTSANPETLLGEMEAKTRELIGCALPTHQDGCTLGGQRGRITRSGVRDQPGRHGETPSLLKIQKISRAWWCVPIVPATEEAEAGESLEPRRRRLQ